MPQRQPKRPGPIIACGGGGFTQRSDPALDDFVLGYAGAPFGRIGYIGAASADDPERLEAFHALLAPRVAEARALLPHHEGDAVRSFLDGLDLVYVGGGDTARLMRRLERIGAPPLLREAWLGGMALAGVSAGAICWFEAALARGADGALARIGGLGFTAGSVCAHVSSEPDRRPAYAAAIAAGELAPGLAIDDGAAVVIEAGEPPRAFAARPGAWAYRVSVEGFESLASV